jgi:O-antigen/teichoic acid export membrane protein
MSTAIRLISGTAAAWSRILLTVVSQVALVPIYLSYWRPETYGVWLALQSLIIMMTMFDLGHHMYVGYELFRYSRKDMVTFCKYLWSAVMVGLVVAVFEVSLVGVFIYFDFVPYLVGATDPAATELIDQAGIALFLLSINWVVTSAVAGFFVRALETYGYHARLAWWGVAGLIISQVCPAVAVMLGADLVQAGLVTLISSAVFEIPIYIDMFRLMAREKIYILKPSWSLGFHNFFKSTAVTGKLLLENIRQQGVRLVLAPMLGATALVAFSTMRTATNVALQGLNSITNPLMPDLLRFLHERDQTKSEAAFNTIWIVVIVLIAPAVIVLQAIAEPLFELWTKGQITYDPLLFAFLSISVLIYAITQPAIAVVMGNNLTRPQLILSGISAAIVIGGIVVLVPLIGLPGTGISLILAELIAMIGYVQIAKNWLRTRDLTWPSRPFMKAMTSVGIAAPTMIGISLYPSLTWILCLVGLAFCAWNFFTYWSLLPSVVKQWLYESARKIKAKVRNAIPG